MQAGPEMLVVAPPPRPPLRGLLQAAEVVEHGPDEAHWQAGIAWRPHSNAPVSTVDPCAIANLPNVPNAMAPLRARPVQIVVADVCSGFPAGNEFVERVTATIKAKEWAAIEAEFELGTLVPSNPHLSDTSAPYSLLAGGVNLSPADALATLDEAIGNARIGQGMIHAPWYVVDKWVNAQVLWAWEGGSISDRIAENPGNPTLGVTLHSPAGNLIVAGSGYSGNDPATGNPVAAHASMYAYATGLVTVHRDRDLTITPDADDWASAMDRDHNTVIFRASRMYVVRWSRTLAAAVKVSTPYTAVP